MAPWVSEFVLGRALNRHHFNVALRRQRSFNVTVYTMPKIKGNTPLYSDIDATIPFGAEIVYRLKVYPKPGPKLDTSAWSFRNDKPIKPQTEP